MKYKKGEMVMQKKLMKYYLKTQIVASNKIRSFMSEERGASDMVAVVVLIVIILGVAITFKSSLTNVVNGMISKLNEFIK